MSGEIMTQLHFIERIKEISNIIVREKYKVMQVCTDNDVRSRRNGKISKTGELIHDFGDKEFNSTKRGFLPLSLNPPGSLLKFYFLMGVVERQAGSFRRRLNRFNRKNPVLFVNIAYRDCCGRAGIGSFSQKGAAIPLSLELRYYLCGTTRENIITQHESYLEDRNDRFRSHRNLPRRCKSRKAQPHRDPGREKLHFTQTSSSGRRRKRRKRRNVPSTLLQFLSHEIQAFPINSQI